MTELKTIDKYLEGFDTTDMEPKRKEWILNASEVLVPATTLNRRVMARFDPDSCPEFKKFTRKWRKDDNQYQLDSFCYRDTEGWRGGVKNELQRWKMGIKTFEECTITLDMMRLVETIMGESVLGIRENLDLLDIAGGLCSPWPDASEWLTVRRILENWKARKEEVNNDEDLLGSVTKDIEKMTVGDN